MNLKSFNDLQFHPEVLQNIKNAQTHDEEQIVALVTKVVAQYKNLQHLKDCIRDTIKSSGYIIFKNFDFETDQLDNLKYRLLTFASIIGKPTAHSNDKKDFVWEIKTDTTETNTNFSRSNSPIPLHTDSQFKENPEHYFLLYVINSAKDDDGYTTIASFNEIKHELLKTATGRKYYSILKSEKYPSLIPNIFSNRENINWSPIIVGDTIRYRMDTILSAIERQKNTDFIERIKALRYLEKIVTTKINIEKIKLHNNDMIIIDNHHFLHGRTSFNDSQRFLLRVRFN